MDWLLRLQDSPRDRQATREFDAWLSRSPGHADAWSKASRTWRLMGEVPPAYEHLWKAGTPSRQAYSGRSVPARRAARRSWKHTAAGVAVAMAVAVFLVVAGPSIMLRMEADYMTATAESRVVRLDDGSIVTLGADSAIAADMSGTKRRVRLLSGEALFEVTHDPSRPFVVDADGVDVSVLGTVFNVQLGAAATTVELAQGAVAIGYDAGRDENVALEPGETALVDRRAGTIVKGTIAPDEVGAWRHGRLFVNDATIGSVVEQLRRYHPAWITVMDNDLAAQRVTGLYDLRDPDRALRALVQPHGGHVRAISRYVRLVSRL